MQLYAFDQSGQLILATQAQKKLNYHCLECGAVVRVREGFIRHSHFYHLKSHAICRQNGKSLAHLQAQIHLKNLIPEVSLEHRFQEISRIADVFWHSKKIVFEIQCSSLLREEMEARVRDYRAIGNRVVWILHDKLYNQWRLSALEYGLRNQPHYYTNMNEKGEGIFYDQWQYIEGGRRKQSLPPLVIDPRKPYIICDAVGFEGDLGSLARDHPYLIRVQEKENELAKLKIKFSILEFLNQTYEKIMKTLLKPYCD